MRRRDIEARAKALAEDARRRPGTAKASLRWIELAERESLRAGDFLLAEALEDFAGAVRRVLCEIRREDAEFGEEAVA